MATWKSRYNWKTPPAAVLDLIHQLSVDAEPGEPVSLAGDFGPNAQVWGIYGTVNVPVKLMPVTEGATKLASQGLQIVEIPSSWPKNTYKLWVEDTINGTPVVSTPKIINRAQADFFHHNEVTAGGRLMLHGRNLAVNPTQAECYLIPRNPLNGTAPVGVQITTGSASLGDSKSDMVVLRFPSITPGVEYVPYFWNGYGSKAENTITCPTITGLAVGNNSFGLDLDVIPWAGELDFAATKINAATGQLWDAAAQQWSGPARFSPLGNGSGAADNSLAIDAASNFLTSYTNPATGKTGGVIVLVKEAGKNGQYRTTGTNQIFQKKRTVISSEAGASLYMKGSTPDGNGFRPTITLLPSEYSLGLIDCTYINDTTNTDGSQALTPWANIYNAGAKGFVLARCTLQLNNSMWSQFPECEKQAFVGNTITHSENPRTTKRGPFRLDGSKNVIVANNKTTFCIDTAWNLSHMDTTSVFGNEMIWDADKGDRLSMRDSNYTVNHFLACGGSRRLAIYNNTFKAQYSAFLKDMDGEKNWGEAVLFERPSGANPDNQCGTVTASGPNWLEDNTKQFRNTNLQSGFGGHGEMGIAIVSGKGYGQIRHIAKESDIEQTKLTVSEPWSIQPDSTSRYACCSWSALDCHVKYNTFLDCKRSIMLYWCFAYRVLLKGNKCWNGGAFCDLTAMQSGSIAAGTNKFTPQWAIDVEDNLLDVSTDNINGGTMGQHVAHLGHDPRILGTVGLNTRFRRNQFKAKNPNQNCRIDANFDNEFQYRNRYENTNGQNYIEEEGRPVVANVLHVENKFYNLRSGLHVSSGSKNVYVKNSGNFNAGEILRNEVLGGNSVGGRNMIVRGSTIIPDTTVYQPNFNVPAGSDARTQVDPATGIPAGLTPEAPLMVLSGMAGTDGVIRISNRVFRSDDPGTAAITLNCGATPVVLSNVVCLHAGRGISGGTDSNLTGSDIACYGTNPVLNGQARERGIYLFRPTNVDLQYVTLEGAGGLKIDYWNGDNSVNSKLRLRNFRVRNVIGVRGDFRHSLQFSNVHTKNFLVDWVEVYNEADKSGTEDTINIYNSGGWDADNPMIVRNVFLKGAYPPNATDDLFTGAALSVDGSGNPAERHSEYIRVENAYLVSHGNAAANIAAGAYVTYDGLYAVTTGYLPDGRPMTCSYKAFWIGQFYEGGASMTENYMRNIKAYFVRTKDVRRRAEFSADPAVPSENPNPGIDVANAILLPAPASIADGLEMERQVFVAWRDRLNANNQTCGKRVA